MSSDDKPVDIKPSERYFKYPCVRCKKLIRDGDQAPVRKSHKDRYLYHKWCHLCAHGIAMSQYCERCEE